MTYRSTLLLTVPAFSMALVLSACGGGEDPLAASDDGSRTGETIIVGSTNFAENVMLGELYAQALEDAGHDVQRTMNVGAREVIYDQVSSCGLHVVPEYNQALLNYADPDNEAVEVEEVTELLKTALPEGTAVAEASAAESNTAISVTAETAEEYGLATLDDLAEVAPDLTMGGPPEFETRWDGMRGLEELYGIDFGGFTVLGDISGPITVSAMNGGDVDVAMLQSASPIMVENDFVVLEDTKGLFGVNNVVPFYCEDGLSEEALELLNELSASFTTEDLQQMNFEYSSENRDASDVAGEWLADKDLS